MLETLETWQEFLKNVHWSLQSVVVCALSTNKEKRKGRRTRKAFCTFMGYFAQLAVDRKMTPQNCPFPFGGDPGPYLIHGALVLPESIPKTGSWSVQPVWHSSWFLQAQLCRGSCCVWSRSQTYSVAVTKNSTRWQARIAAATYRIRLRTSTTHQCSRIRILRFFQISEKTWLFTFSEMTCEKVVKSR